jgi:3'-5' exoribonuclease
MYLSDIKENQEFKQQVFVISVIDKKSKNGKSYITGEVRDKSGVYKYNIWDVSAKFLTLPKANSYFLINGTMENYNGNPQINLRNCQPLEESEINLNDFKKTSSLDLDKLVLEIENIVDTFQDDLVVFLAKNILTEKFMKKFKDAPAAENVHSAWVGGLLEHSISVAKLSDFVVKYYNDLYFEGKINRDIVVFGSLFHDIGKVWEYDYSTPNITTTKHGELLGHIYLSAKVISDVALKYKEQNREKDVDNKILRIQHVVLAHHGKFEWGAPVTPKTPEAIIIHYMDNIDAKLMNAWENLKQCKEEFTQRNFIQENARLYNIFLED